MPRKRKRDPAYEVGYGKPPRETRFKQGQSGNPKGRPRGARNLKTELSEELQEKIVIHEAGKRKKVSKQRAIIKRLTEKSLTGDVRAARELLLLALRVLVSEQDTDEIVDLSEADRRLMAEFLARSTPQSTKNSARSSKRSKIERIRLRERKTTT